jgi:cell wall-associated NlpC family hydrolase
VPIIERLLVPLSVVVAAAGMGLLVLAATASSAATAVRAAATSTTEPVRAPAAATTTTTTIATTTTPEPPTTTTTTTTVEPPAPSPVERVVAFARAQLGTPYQRGAAGPGAFDCSGLTRAAYLTIGVDLPHYSVGQAARGRAVDWQHEPIEPGDLVFTRGDTPVIDLGHVGLAESATEWIVASRPGQPVQRAAIPLNRVQRVRRMVDD